MTEETGSTAQTGESGVISAWGCSHDLTPSDVRNNRRFLFVMFAWFVVFVGVHQTIDWWKTSIGWGAWIVATVPTIILTVGFLAFARFLRNADELTRKIQLEALGVGFGGGLVLMLGYGFFEELGAPELGLADGTMAMIIGYVATILLAQRRYR